MQDLTPTKALDFSLRTVLHVNHVQKRKEEIFMKQNITISLDKDLIQTGKVIAAQRGTSLNRMLRQELEKLIRNARQYDMAKKKAIAAMHAGFHSGMDRYPSRDELHER